MLSGLGAFVRGGMEGYRFAEDIDDRQAARERQERLDGIAEEDRQRLHRRQDERDAWDREDRAFTISERDRAVEERDWLADVYRQAAERTDTAMTTPDTGEAGSRLGASSATDAPQAESMGVGPSVMSTGPGQPQMPGAGGNGLGALPGRENGQQTAQTPAQPGQPPARGVQPSTQQPAGGDDNLRRVLADPAFTMQAQQRGMSPEDYWQSLPTPVQQQHRDRVAEHVDVVPPGVDLAFDRRAVEIAQGMLDTGKHLNGRDITPNEAERLRVMIQERSGTAIEQRQQDREAAAMQRISAPGALGLRPPQADTAPSAPGANQPGPMGLAPTQPQAPQPDQGPTQPGEPAAVVPMDQVQSGATSSGTGPGLGTRQAQQRQVAEDTATTWADEYVRTGVPYLEEQLMRRGMIEQAQGLRDWADQRETQAGMRDYARMAFGASTGDFDLFSQSLLSLYNNEGYYGDGMTIDQGESAFVVDSQGNIIGAEVTFVQPDGDRITRRWESLSEIVDEALYMFSPERAFETQLARQDAAVQIEVEAAQSDAEFADWMRKEVFKSQLSGSDNSRVEAAIEAARDATVGWGQLSQQEKLAAVVAELELMEAASAAAAQRPGSAMPTGGDNILRRP